MNHVNTSRLRSPEEIAVNAGADLPRLQIPASNVFAERALRLRQLAAGHAMRDYLLLMAVIAEAQDAGLGHFPQVPLPTAEQAEQAAREGLPLLDTASWPRDPAWRTGLRDYWRVETREGRRLWLFHTPQNPGWFVHGEFA